MMNNSDSTITSLGAEISGFPMCVPGCTVYWSKQSPAITVSRCSQLPVFLKARLSISFLKPNKQRTSQCCFSALPQIYCTFL